jgi:hypothetical protein
MYKLSICIITRNRINHVRSLLDNPAPALKDLSCPVEVIFFDNASSECLNPEEVTRYQHLINFRIIYHESNIGAARNYLAALSNSAGEWCWVLGDDDIYDFKKILKIFNLVNCKGAHDDLIRTSLIHINHSHFVEEGNKHIILKERVHSIDLDTLLNETDYLDLVVGPIGGLLFVSSNIFKMSHLRSRLKANFLYAYANNCVSLSVPLIAIHNSLTGSPDAGRHGRRSAPESPPLEPGHCRLSEAVPRGKGICRRTRRRQPGGPAPGAQRADIRPLPIHHRCGAAPDVGGPEPGLGQRGSFSHLRWHGRHGFRATGRHRRSFGPARCHHRDDQR